MEMNAANVAQHKIFPVKPSFVNKKMDEKGSFGELSTQEIQEIMDKAVPEKTKKARKFGMRLFKVSTKSCKISNMTVEILRIREGYVTTTTIFTLMLQNSLLVLVAPHFANQYKKCQKKS